MIRDPVVLIESCGQGCPILRRHLAYPFQRTSYLDWLDISKGSERQTRWFRTEHVSRAGFPNHDLHTLAQVAEVLAILLEISMALRLKEDLCITEALEVKRGTVIVVCYVVSLILGVLLHIRDPWTFGPVSRL